MRFFTWILLSLVLSGCEKSSQNVPTPQPLKSSDSNITLVALVGDTPIYTDMVDQKILLKLYDLENTIYQLRMESLDAIIEERLSRHKTTPSADTALTDWQISEVNVNKLLMPPKRPRIQFPVDMAKSPALMRGYSDAPVQLSVFCSYQSSHCSRLQPVLLKMLDEYSEHINIHYFDFPQRFHRYSYQAAKAARCVSDQPHIWRFQDMLFSSYDDLDQESLLQKANILNLDIESFKQCLNSSQYDDIIDFNTYIAKTVGVGKVPVVFVNGLYLPSPHNYTILQNLIELEMANLGYKTAKAIRESLIVSTLPLSLKGTSVSSTPEESTALISIKGESSKFYLKGDFLMQGVTLESISHDRIFIDNQGDIEVILLWNKNVSTNVVADMNGQRNEDGNDESVTDELESTELTPGYEQNRLPEPTAIFSLSRQWVDSQLLDQYSLEKEIGSTEHVVEGFNLVKLSHTELSEFYKTLGLKPNDVLMMVDNQWVHSGQNPMWEALRNNDVVKLAVMRKGLPVVYEYHMKDE